MLRTFGQLSLEGASFQRLKPLLLLAYLAVEGGQDRTTLASLFWPDSEDPLNSLSVTLSRIRQTHRVPIVGNRYTVEVSLETDVQAFLSAAGRGNHKAALDLYQGPFLYGVVLPGVGVNFENWLYDTRESLAAQASQSLLDLAEQKAQAGQYDLAAYYAETAYNLPAAPPAEAETLHLIHRLLREGGSAVANTVETEARELGISLVSRSAATPKQTDEPTPNNLTKRQPSFVGREAELDTLAAQLADPECRLLTLVGPGGIGKSRLALRLAHGELECRSWEGIYLVSLATLQEAELIPLRIAEVLSLSFRGKESPLELVTRFVGEKRLLIVLDNVEHLIEETQILQTLLASCPNLTLLVTSRVRLNLHEEWSVALAGLSYPPPDALLDDLLTYSAPELFYRRAKQVCGTLTFTPEDALHVTHLCRRVEGSPLALELAAPWLRALSMADIVQALEHDLDLLVDTHKDKEERHQSMSAVLEHSWGLLATEEQLALAKLSVFKSGFTREAAVQVADVSLLKLTDLIDRSLLRHEQEGRYGFHPLTQQFAGQKLSEDERRFAEARNRHFNYFLTFAEMAEPELTGSDQVAWLERLDRDRDNFRKALRSVLSGGEAEATLRLTAALRRFWTVRGYFPEGAAWSRKALALIEGKAEVSTQLKIKVLGGLGLFCHFRGEYEDARTHFAAVVTLAKIADHQAGVSAGLSNLGIVAYAQGDYSAARRYYDEALTIERKLGDELGVAGSLQNLGNLARSRNDPGAAAGYFAESLSIKKRLRDRIGAADSLNSLGLTAYEQGDFDTAQKFYKESLRTQRELGNRLGTAYTLHNLDLLSIEREDYLSARDYLIESLQLKEALDNQKDMAAALETLGDVAVHEGDYQTAETLYGRSLEISRDLGAKEGIASSLHRLGKLANVKGRREAASGYLKAALKMFGALGLSNRALYSLEEFGHLACQLQQFEWAAKLWAKSAALRASAGKPMLPSEQPRYEQNVAVARQGLGAATFRAAWKAGEVMTLDQGVEYALGGQSVDN